MVEPKSWASAAGQMSSRGVSCSLVLLPKSTPANIVTQGKYFCVPAIPPR